MQQGPDTSEDAAALCLRIDDAGLRQAYLYWRQKAAGRQLPSRGDIDPADIPKLLPDIMLVDVLPENRYRYRLIGARNADAHGLNVRGHYLDEILPGPDYKEHVLGLYDECVQARRALYFECLFLSMRRPAPTRHTKVLFLPLSSDGNTIDIVMVVQIYTYIDQSTRSRHMIDSRPFKEIAHILL
ncbi:MAG TPA: PAS domain-containing protein [Stellaceae bacterium]|nr:PAS domain-containing protein [Stellaceae bacterium]